MERNVVWTHQGSVKGRGGFHGEAWVGILLCWWVRRCFNEKSLDSDFHHIWNVLTAHQGMVRLWWVPASWRRALGVGDRRRRGRPGSCPAAVGPDIFSPSETIQKICLCFSVTWCPPIASGTLPGRLLWEERGEGAGLWADAAELSPQEGERFEPDPVEPGEVAGAPVSWNKQTLDWDMINWDGGDFRSSNFLDCIWYKM